MKLRIFLLAVFVMSISFAQGQCTMLCWDFEYAMPREDVRIILNTKHGVRKIAEIGNYIRFSNGTFMQKPIETGLLHFKEEKLETIVFILQSADHKADFQKVKDLITKTYVPPVQEGNYWALWELPGNEWRTIKIFFRDEFLIVGFNDLEDAKE